jgi:hypothetical protein
LAAIFIGGFRFRANATFDLSLMCGFGAVSSVDAFLQIVLEATIETWG